MGSVDRCADAVAERSPLNCLQWSWSTLQIDSEQYLNGASGRSECDDGSRDQYIRHLRADCSIVSLTEFGKVSPI